MREALARADDDFLSAEDRPARVARARARAPARRGGLAAFLRARPSATLGAAALTALLIGVAVNALVLQKERHPAPLFAAAPPPQSAPAKPAIEASVPPAPPARPVEAARHEAAPAPAPTPAARVVAREETKKDPIAALIRTGSIERAPAAAAHEAKPRDSIGALLKSGNPVPPANIPSAEAKTVTQAQRALARLGYGVKPDGVFGASTRQAIERFERDRKMPVTGDLSARNLRELASLSGLAAE